MKSKRSLMPERALIPLGLFIICGTFLVSHDWIKMPDFVTGSLMGLGIGLEIMGVINFKKAR